MITLPAAPDVVTPRAPVAAVPVAGRSRRSGEVVVLSVEDNPANSEVIARYLGSRPGTTLYAAASGPEGVELAGTHHPDVILLDLHLPGLSGEEVLDRLQADPATADIRVIVLSADATTGTIRSLRARGVADYLTKPVDLRQLGAAIDAAVRPAAETVLYVDDEPDNIVLVEALLDDRPGIHLVSASTATEGLRLARAEHPRLILLDRRLPDMLGTDVLRRIKESPDTASIPVVMLSGDSGRAHVAEFAALGAAEFLAKPFEIDALLRLVDRYVSPSSSDRPGPRG
jgi:CheY-like chemotaxis protein